MTQQDKSNYFKGLLILVGKDRNISELEKISLRKIAKVLGFNKEFCDNAISELLDNEFIIESPPEFSDPEIAKAFVIDGIRIAFSDKEIHIFELNWLKSVSEKNFLDTEWCIQKYNDNKDGKLESEKFQIEIFFESKDNNVSR